MERSQWFLDRIGKVVFRNKTTCQCATCNDVYENGLIIHDEMHADYLQNCEAEYTVEGYPLQYFDTRQEAIEFESQTKNKQPNQHP